jgi:hypothetical protein
MSNIRQENSPLYPLQTTIIDICDDMDLKLVKGLLQGEKLTFNLPKTGNAAFDQLLNQAQTIVFKLKSDEIIYFFNCF